jgi:hypothetical protein
LTEMVAAPSSEVPPPQPEELAPPHAGGRGHPEGREEPVSGGGPKEGAELLGGPARLLDLGDGTLTWGVGDEGDVAGDESAAHGVAEGAADDQVDLVHGLGCQCGAVVARVE